MLATLFEFSFLCLVAITNLCLGFALASRLGWGPPIALFFQLEPGETRLRPGSNNANAAPKEAGRAVTTPREEQTRANPSPLAADELSCGAPPSQDSSESNLAASHQD